MLCIVAMRTTPTETEVGDMVYTSPPEHRRTAKFSVKKKSLSPATKARMEYFRTHQISFRVNPDTKDVSVNVKKNENA